jgi:hypothetical protein
LGYSAHARYESLHGGLSAIASGHFRTHSAGPGAVRDGRVASCHNGVPAWTFAGTDDSSSGCAKHATVADTEPSGNVSPAATLSRSGVSTWISSRSGTDQRIATVHYAANDSRRGQPTTVPVVTNAPANYRSSTTCSATTQTRLELQRF